MLALASISSTGAPGRCSGFQPGVHGGRNNQGGARPTSLSRMTDDDQVRDSWPPRGRPSPTAGGRVDDDEIDVLLGRGVHRVPQAVRHLAETSITPNTRGPGGVPPPLTPVSAGRPFEDATLVAYLEPSSATRCRRWPRRCGDGAGNGDRPGGARRPAGRERVSGGSPVRTQSPAAGGHARSRLRGPDFRCRRHVARPAAVVRKGWTPSSRPVPPRADLDAPGADRAPLHRASISPNTRRAYSGALRRLDAWFDGRPLKDATVAAYLSELHDHRRVPSEHVAGGRRRASGPVSPASPRSREGASAAVQGDGPRRSPRHLPPAPAAAAALPRRVPTVGAGVLPGLASPAS